MSDKNDERTKAEPTMAARIWLAARRRGLSERETRRVARRAMELHRAIQGVDDERDC